MTRKLVTVRKISEVLPIEGADSIELVKIDGWQTVAKKGEFKQDDLCVYFEIDSYLPVEDRYEFLRKSSYKNLAHLGEGFRLKTIKLRNKLSQGLALPLNVFPELDIYPTIKFKENVPDYTIRFTNRHSNKYDVLIGETDISELLGVKKYEQPECLSGQSGSGQAKGSFPSFIRKTDQERIQNLWSPSFFNLYKEEQFEVTTKLDGSSMTVYALWRDGELTSGVCSRNQERKLDDDTGTFVQVAKSKGLLFCVEEYAKKHKRSIALQGELMGPGIQGNPEKLTELDFYLFDIYDIDKQIYFSYEERKKFIFDYHAFVYREAFHAFASDVVYLKQACDGTLDSLLDYADRLSIRADVAEGVVFKHVSGDFSFKVINNEYLLAGKD